VGIITLANFKSYMAITNEDKDSFLQSFIDGINLYVETLCHRSFLSQRVIREVNDGSDGKKLWLGRTPITEVERIEYGYSTLTVLDSSYYDFTGNAIFTEGISDFIFKKKESFWKVTYTGGYLQEQMPSDLILATCELAGLLYKDESGRLGVTNRGMGSEMAESFTRELTPTSKRILNSYKKVIL